MPPEFMLDPLVMDTSPVRLAMQASGGERVKAALLVDAAWRQARDALQQDRVASPELRTPVAAVKATVQLTQRTTQRGSMDPEPATAPTSDVQVARRALARRRRPSPTLPRLISAS